MRLANPLTEGVRFYGAGGRSDAFSGRHFQPTKEPERRHCEFGNMHEHAVFSSLSARKMLWLTEFDKEVSWCLNGRADDVR